MSSLSLNHKGQKSIVSALLSESSLSIRFQKVLLAFFYFLATFFGVLLVAFTYFMFV